MNKMRKDLLWFLVLAFLPAWVLFSIPLLFGEPGSQAWQSVSIPAWALAMWSPGLAAILVTRVFKRQSIKVLNLNRLGDKKVYLWAWLLPILLTLSVLGVTLLLRTGELDSDLTVVRQGLEAMPESENISVSLILTAQTVFAFTLAPLINTLFALGEELGWRGFLLPTLRSLGKWHAVVLSGAIWGFWHLPAVLQGLNYPGHPIAGVFLMVGFCILLGAVFSWLYFRTESPWAPALAHGTVNAVAGMPLLFLKNVDQAFGGSIASLSGWIPMGMLVGWLALKTRWAYDLPQAPLQAESESL